VAFAAIVVYAVLFDLFGYFPATRRDAGWIYDCLKVKPSVADPGHYGWLCDVFYLMFVVWLRSASF
jgi:hypothetical protein